MSLSGCQVSPQAIAKPLPVETPQLPPLTYQQLRDLMVHAFKLEYLKDVRQNMIGFDSKAYYTVGAGKAAA